MEQGARNVDAPALPAGESADRAVQDGSEVQQLRELRQPLRECRAPDAVERGPALQVVPHAQRPVQYGILKHHAKLAPDPVRVAVRIRAVNFHAAAILGQLAAQDVDGGGFARAVDAEEGEQLSLLHAEAQVLYRLYLPKALAQVINPDDVMHIFPVPPFSVRVSAHGRTMQLLSHLDPDLVPLRVGVGVGVEIKADDREPVLPVKRDRRLIARLRLQHDHPRAGGRRGLQPFAEKTRRRTTA